MIARRTPLKRSTTPLKRTPLRRVSKSHAKSLRSYSALRKQYLALFTHCQIKQEGCTGEATEIHHGAKRGKNLNETATWFSACRSCHDWIHANGRMARELGFLK